LSLGRPVLGRVCNRTDYVGKFAVRTVNLSNSPKELTNWTLDRLGDSQEGLNGNDFLSSLNFANVLGIKLRSFSQALLSQASALPMLSYRFPNDLAMS
jgi:hypothetical protein